MKPEHIPDEKWNSIYKSKPENGQMCMSKILGEHGYAGSCTFIDGYFETYEDQRNRLVIIRWKHDLWMPLEETK